MTGSADKNIKVWGLDFGDCHRSLFAHADSVMAVAFVPNTHYLFTAGEPASCPRYLFTLCPLCLFGAIAALPYTCLATPLHPCLLYCPPCRQGPPCQVLGRRQV